MAIYEGDVLGGWKFLDRANLLAVYAKARSMVNVYIDKTRETPGAFMISVVVIVLGADPSAFL